MKASEVKEALALVEVCLEALLSAVPSADALRAADLRRAVRGVTASHIRSHSIGAHLALCFDLAVTAGASYGAVGGVRATALNTSVTGWVATYLRSAIVQFSLTAQARIVADLDLTSRNEVDAYRTTLVAAFDEAEAAASEAMDATGYRTMVALRAAVVRDLMERSRPLPRMVTYTYGRSRPVLWISNRLYGDGSRSDEIVAENRPVHPLFMPRLGRALSE